MFVPCLLFSFYDYVLVWKCQGAGSLAFMNSLIIFSDLIVLQEPRISSKNADDFVKKLKFARCRRIEVDGSSEGIWLL